MAPLNFLRSGFNTMDDVYTWVATYGEGDELHQYNEDGSENRYADINREKLKEFHILKEGKTVFAMKLSPEQRLIYRRRVSMNNDGELKWVVYLVGWQQTIGGENVQSLNWFLSDGTVLNTGRFEDKHFIFYSPELLPFEQDLEFVSDAQL